MTIHTDILIQGGGFAGMTLALLAAKAGHSVVVVDQANIPTRIDGQKDVRTVAISAGSRSILTEAGVWSAEAFPMCPITDIQILDGDGADVYLEFGAHEVEGGSAFGHIVDNIDLRRVLIEKAAENDKITHILEDSLENWQVFDGFLTGKTKKGTEITAKLLVGADGKTSNIRKQANMGVFGWDYHEKALVCTIGHEHPHQNIAIERFRADGPFAVLPMEDDADGMHRSAIVWTLKKNDPRLDRQAEQADIQALLPEFYGPIIWMGKSQAFPLTLQQTYTLIGERTALVADAGHVMHPIAGQGLNVGLRDVAELAELLKGAADPGAASLLNAYDRKRRMDVTSMMIFTDKLNRLFGNNIAPIRWARRFGLKTVGRIAPVKDFFMKRAMGLV